MTGVLAATAHIHAEDEPPKNSGESYTWASSALIATHSPLTLKGDWPEERPVKRVRPYSGTRGTKTGRRIGQCVQGVNAIVGRRVIRGWAGAIRPTTDEPSVGDVLLTREGRGHAAVIVGETPREWVLRESNFDWDGAEEIGRHIRKDSPLIRGAVDAQ